MPNITIEDAIMATRAQEILVVDPSVDIAGFAIDSRSIIPGGMFVCFDGEVVDGNDYATDAIDAGASVIMMTRKPESWVVDKARDNGCSILRAEGDDAEEALLRLASHWRSRNPQWRVIGITGSVGKTTTKDMLAAGLSAIAPTHATSGNHNNLLGVPLTILSASSDDEYVVCEMGMDCEGELTRLSDAVRPDIALITNIGTAHIGRLGSREAIANAKAEILHGMRRTSYGDGIPSCIAIPEDDDFAGFIEHEHAIPAGVETLHVGNSDGSYVRLEELMFDDGYPTATLSFPDGDAVTLTLGIPGRHVVVNLMLAFVAIHRLGADIRIAAKAIEDAPRTGMRLEIRKADGKPTVIDDSYNAGPSSMGAALDVLSTMECRGRKVTVLGEIGELGSHSAELHGCVGAYAAAKMFDMLVFVGHEGATAMEQAATTMGYPASHIIRCDDGDEAYEILCNDLTKDDLVLVKASRFMALDKLASRLQS